MWVDLDAAPLIASLQDGALLQMHLQPTYGPVGAFRKIGEVLVLKKLSEMAVDDSVGEKTRARHMFDFYFLDHPGPIGPGNPPAFPLHDVVLVYRNSDHPDRLFKAYVEAKTWKSRIAPLDPGDGETASVIDDAFAHTEVLIWDKDKTYANQMTTWQTRFGLVIEPWQRIFDPEGSDRIAGLACRKFYVHPPIAGMDTAHVCITGDGVVLRHTNLDGTLTEVIKVAYEPVPRGRVTVPTGYKKRS